MPADTNTPSTGQAEALDAFADALYDLLHARAQSIGILDIGIELNGWHVDGELMYSTGPDMGFTLDSRTGECRYCELLPGNKEAWLEGIRGDLHVLDAEGDEIRDALALELLAGLLDARRPLLKRDAAGD
jgi:hypothetical protein